MVARAVVNRLEWDRNPHFPQMRQRNREKQNGYNRKHYLANKDKRILLSKQRRVDIKTLLDSIKARGCFLCPEKEICCMDFHHLDPNKKIDNLSVATKLGWGNKKILEEVEKCAVICANCHRKIENKNR